MVLNLSQLRADYKATYKSNWPLAEKTYILIEVTKVEIRYQHRSSQAAKRVRVAEIIEAAGISLRTLQRWKKLYRDHGLKGITPQERGHPPKKDIPDKIQKIIENYRKKYLWGSEIIQAHLAFDHYVFINRYQIDRFLSESGLRSQYPCTTIKKQKAKRKKHTKKVVVLNPGEHTQMDVKYQLHLLKNKEKAFVYNFIDHASNWSYKRAYQAITAENTRDFMNHLIKACPFKIDRLQTDNGIEFTYKWASKHIDDPKEHPLFKFCHRESIRHKLIPPGEKELQGLVERSHRQDDQELYSRIKPENLKEFNDSLEFYYRWRNRRRRFKKLGWLTSDEWLKQYRKQNMPSYSQQEFHREYFKQAA